MAGGGREEAEKRRSREGFMLCGEQITSDITGYLRSSGCTDCCGDFIPKIALL